MLSTFFVLRVNVFQNQQHGTLSKITRAQLKQLRIEKDKDPKQVKRDSREILKIVLETPKGQRDVELQQKSIDQYL